MVMIFESEKARNFLLRNGTIYTFRVKRRKKLGRDWITERRGGQKIAEVLIEEVGEFAPTGLAPYVGLSGFNSLEEWTAEIRRLNGGKLPEKGWLYKVALNVEKWKREVLALIGKLSEEHSVPTPPVKFLPPPSKSGRPWAYKREVRKTRLGVLKITQATPAVFIVDKQRGAWIEFYGKPTRSTVVHEFKHYLKYLHKKEGLM